MENQWLSGRRFPNGIRTDPWVNMWLNPYDVRGCVLEVIELGYRVTVYR